MYELENIKTEIIDAVTLAYPNSEDTFMLDKDASDHCIGAESSQRKSSRKRKRSDLVLWKSPYSHRKIKESNVATQKRHQKLRLHNDCGPT